MWWFVVDEVNNYRRIVDKSMARPAGVWIASRQATEQAADCMRCVELGPRGSLEPPALQRYLLLATFVHHLSSVLHLLPRSIISTFVFIVQITRSSIIATADCPIVKLVESCAEHNSCSVLRRRRRGRTPKWVSRYLTVYWLSSMASRLDNQPQPPVNHPPKPSGLSTIQLPVCSASVADSPLLQSLIVNAALPCTHYTSPSAVPPARWNVLWDSRFRGGYSDYGQGLPSSRAREKGLR